MESPFGIHEMSPVARLQERRSGVDGSTDSPLGAASTSGCGECVMMGTTFGQDTCVKGSSFLARNASHSSRVNTPGVVPMARTQLAPRALA